MKMTFMKKFNWPLATLLLLSVTATANQIVRAPGSPVALEVDFLSVEIRANGTGSVVARPCDEQMECDLIYSLISAKTTFMLNGEKIGLKQARREKWDIGVLAYDEQKNAVWMDMDR